MGPIRPPAVAGAFYPEDPDILRRTVARVLGAAVPADLAAEPRMLIAPHAGYVYSGTVAAAAYRVLADTAAAGPIVMLGPAHFLRFSGLAAPGVAGLATPLGVVELAAELAEAAAAHPAVIDLPAAHAREHSLEVQLPFLQVVRDAPTVLPLLTGEVEYPAVADVLDALLGADVIAVISSDLSHYLDYESARLRDAATAAAITALEPDRIQPEDACGRTAIQAGLEVARRRGWVCKQLELANSGDTAGPPDRVVGYGAFTIGPPL